MPDHEGQLRNLLPLLAQFHERCLPAGWVQELCNPDEDLAILIADSSVHAGDRIGQTLSAHAAESSSILTGVDGAVATHSQATIVLLLRRSGSGLNLGMLLSDQGGVLLLVLLVRLGLVVLLLLLLVLQPRGISLRVLMLVREDVLALRL